MAQNGINAGDAVWTITGDIDPLDAAMNTADARMESSAASAVMSWGKVGLAVTAAGAAITGAFGLAVNEAGSFDSAMAAVASLGTQGMDELEVEVRKTAVAFGLDLTDAAKGAYDMISSGADAATAPKILEDAARAAAAGQTDLATSIQLGMGMANAFGIELTDLSGVFDASFIAVNKGVMTFEELAQSAGRSAPAFAANKIALDEMLGAAAALTLGAVPASEAFTQLNAIVTGFTRQGQSAILETKGLGGALQWLAEQTGGDKQKMLEFLGSTEAMGGALALTGTQAKSFGDIMAEMKDKVGATSAAFDIIAEKDPTFAWKQLKATMQDLSITIGQALMPALKRILDAVTPIITGFASWTKENPGLTSTLAVITAAVGALMLVLGPLLIAMPGIIAVTGLVGGAFTALAAGPIVAIIAAFVGVGLAGYELARNWGGITDAISDWTKPAQAADVAGETIYTDIDQWLLAVDVRFDKTKQNAGDWSATTSAMKTWGADISAFWAGVGESVAWALTNPAEAIQNVWSGMVSFFDTVCELITIPFRALYSVIMTVFDAAARLASSFGFGMLTGMDPSGGTGGAAPDLSTTGLQGLASGGPVTGGMPYIVGEQGPELFVPDTAGRIVPNGAGSGASVTINMGGVQVRSDADIRSLSESLASSIGRELRGMGAFA